MGVMIFNNISTTDMGVVIQSPPVYEIPTKDYEVVHVEGRSGDIVIDKGSYQNVRRSYYLASIFRPNTSFVLNANAIASWLMSANGYARLEDSYEPNYYRLALYRDSNAMTNYLDKATTLQVNFECKPQRFLKSGDDPIIVESLDEHVCIVNPTNFIALPEITADWEREENDSGPLTLPKSGTINSGLNLTAERLSTATIYIGVGGVLGNKAVDNGVAQGDYTWIDGGFDEYFLNVPIVNKQVIFQYAGASKNVIYDPEDIGPLDVRVVLDSEINNDLTIDFLQGEDYNSPISQSTLKISFEEEGIVDSDLQECYTSTKYINDKVSLTNGFPKLYPGVNWVKASYGILKNLSIKPRWWTL